MLVQVVAGACGDPRATVQNNTGGVQGPNRTYGNGSNASYVLGTPLRGIPGAQYRLCWAHDPAGLGDFTVEVDSDSGSS